MIATYLAGSPIGYVRGMLEGLAGLILVWIGIREILIP